MNHNHLTISERQKLAELRRMAQKAPSPADAFISRMRREVREARENTHAKRIKHSIIALLTILFGIVLVSLL